jgi:TnpA family transposase
MTPQKTNNNIIEDLVDSEGDESLVADFKRMLISLFNERKEDIQKKKTSMTPRRTHTHTKKKLEKI